MARHQRPLNALDWLIQQREPFVVAPYESWSIGIQCPPARQIRARQFNPLRIRGQFRRDTLSEGETEMVVCSVVHVQ